MRRPMPASAVWIRRAHKRDTFSRLRLGNKGSYGKRSVIGATLNADGVLAMLGIDLSLGDISLEYAPGEDGGRLTAACPRSALRQGSSAAANPFPPRPKVTSRRHRAIELVQSAAAIFDGATAVNFDIGGAQLNINGVSLDLGGKGTVGWTDGGVVDYVALDLTLDAAAGGAEDSSPTELKLTYSAAANGGYEIKIALNGAYAAEKSVLVITQADIEDLKAQVNAIAELVDKFTAQGAAKPWLPWLRRQDLKLPRPAKAIPRSPQTCSKPSSAATAYSPCSTSSASPS